MVGVGAAVASCTGHTVPLIMREVRVEAWVIPSALMVGCVLLLGVHRGAGLSLVVGGGVGLHSPGQA